MTEVLLDRLTWISKEDVKDITELIKSVSVTLRNFVGSSTIVYPHEEENGWIGLPRAFGLNYAKTKNLTINDRTHKIDRDWPGLVFPDKGGYREGQKDSIEALVKYFKNNYGGLLKADCGTGKTLMAIAVAAELQTSALVLIHKDDLREEWHKTAKQFFPGVILGHVQRDVWDFNRRHLVTASAQTLARRYMKGEVPRKFLGSFGLVIFDEGHRYPAKTFETILKMFPARYRLGVSATWKRKDGLKKLIDYHVGSIIHTCKAKSLTGKYKKISWTTSLRDSRFDKGYGVNQSQWVTAIAEDTKYNQWLAGTLLKSKDKERKILVVSDRISQLDYLFDTLAKELSLGRYYGVKSKAELERSKKANIILGTYGKISEGTDIDDLDTLILATPRSDIEQVLGRIRRPHENKKELLVADIVFDTRYMERLFDKREAIYRRLGFKEAP